MTAPATTPDVGLHPETVDEMRPPCDCAWVHFHRFRPPTHDLCPEQAEWVATWHMPLCGHTHPNVLLCEVHHARLIDGSPWRCTTCGKANQRPDPLALERL